MNYYTKEHTFILYSNHGWKLSYPFIHSFRVFEVLLHITLWNLNTILESLDTQNNLEYYPYVCRDETKTEKK